MTELQEAGLNADRLQHLKTVMEEDIRQDRYCGGVIVVARNGVVGLHEAVGYANSERQRKVEKDSVFSLFSVSKSFANVLIFRAIERGQFGLATRVSEVIPEFSGAVRETITVFHLLTHQSGLPPIYTPKPDMYVDRLDEMVQAICEMVHPEAHPGEKVAYAPLAGHALMSEMVVRTDPAGRSYRQIAEDEIIKPLGLGDTSVGRRRDLKDRHLVPDFRGNAPINHPGHSDLGAQGAFEEEDAEMPWVGVVSTGRDMFRFAEMLRRGGELDGVRILGPAILEKARKNWTGDRPNELYKRFYVQNRWPVIPAYIGLGFPVRGTAISMHLYGTLASPETFGIHGAGTTLIWVDPERQMTFIGLCTGVMSPADNYRRWCRLSDIAHSAAI